MRQQKVCIEVIEAEADLAVQSTTRCLLFDCQRFGLLLRWLRLIACRGEAQTWLHDLLHCIVIFLHKVEEGSLSVHA